MRAKRRPLGLIILAALGAFGCAGPGTGKKAPPKTSGPMPENARIIEIAVPGITPEQSRDLESRLGQNPNLRSASVSQGRMAFSVKPGSSIDLATLNSVVSASGNGLKIVDRDVVLDRNVIAVIADAKPDDAEAVKRSLAVRPELARVGVLGGGQFDLIFSPQKNLKVSVLDEALAQSPTTRGKGLRISNVVWSTLDVSGPKNWGHGIKSKVGR